MDARRDRRLFLGRRPPPGRTYGSKDRSERVVPPNHDKLRTVPKTPLPRTHQPRGLVRPRNQTPSTASAECESRRISTDGAHGNRSRSADEISRMVRSAGEGGQRGRAAAVAVAQACKSVVSRKAMGVDGVKSVLDELSSVTQKILRGGGSQQQQDEAIVHCLAVSMFTLSKDRSLVQRFDASVMSTLAFLIEGYGGSDTGDSSARGLTTAMGATSLQSWPVLTGEREDDKFDGTESMLLLGERQEKRNAHASRVHLRASLEGPRQRGDERNTSTSTRSGDTFISEDNEKESGALGDEAFGGVCSVGRIGGVGTSFIGNGLNDGKKSGTRGSAQTPACHHAAYHGSAGVMVRARMLLDITDMLPWGLANRHLISAADLGLATMLNVVGRSSPENEAAGAANCAGTGDSVEEDFSTQGSAPSRCDSGTLSTDGLSESGKATTTGSSAVLLEMNRLGRTGFLIPLVVAGASVLEHLAASRRVSARGAVTDPSSLRQVHRLLLALRLLDLATLENSPEGDVATGYSEEDASEPHRGSELAGALLYVVSLCEAVNAGNRGARRNEESAVAGVASGQGRLGVRVGRFSRGQRQPHPDEVAIRVQECLLAALRVLVNLTHDDAKVCAVVGARGGLETLMLCLVAHSDCEVQDSDDDSSPLAGCGGMDSRASLGYISGGDARLPGAGSSMDDADDGAGRSRRAGGDFDAQILSMGALINCVELQESADNCTAMGTLVVSPPPTGPSAELSRGRLRGLRRTCLAPEFLVKLLVFCTRSFARHLEVSRTIDDTCGGDREETSAPSSKQPNDGVEGGNAPDRQNRGHADSSAQAVAPSTHPATPTVSLKAQKQQQQQEDEEEEEEMSHSEGADLVLGGHCALLLGLLIRDREEIRHLALSVLPERAATLIVRVLEAFMALQYQAGVLTEEVALKVQSLVEELEEMEGLPVPDEKSDPFELDSEEEAPLATLPTTGSATALTRGKGRKRPRSPATGRMQLGTFPTPLSGQWAAYAESDDCADGFSLSEVRPRSGTLREGRALPSWLPQANGTLGSSSSVSDNQAPPWKLPPPPDATEEARLAASRSQDEANANDARPLDRRSSGYDKTSKRSFGARGVGWRVGSAAGGRLGLSCGGAGTRNWLGGSPPRAYGGRHPRTYGRQAWTKSGGSLSRLRSLSVLDGSGSGSGGEGKLAEAAILAEGEQIHEGGGVDKADVFCMTSDESEDGLPKERSGAGGDGRGNGGEGDNGSSVRVGVRPKRGRVTATPGEGAKSIFDLDWSSDESPADLDSQAGRPKAPRATHGLFSAAAGDPIGSTGGLSQASGDARALADSRPDEKCPPGGPRAHRAAGKKLSARGIGPRSGGSSAGRGMSRGFTGAASVPRGLESTTNASVKGRVASLSLFRGMESESLAHDGEADADEDRPPPSFKSAPVPEGRDRKDAARAGQRRRAESLSAAIGFSARGRSFRERKAANAGTASNTGNAGNIFQMLDSDGDDDDASSKEAARRSVFDFGDDSE